MGPIYFLCRKIQTVGLLFSADWRSSQTSAMESLNIVSIVTAYPIGAIQLA
jgi:hypothetical protein